MTREEALIQITSVFNVICDCMEQVEQICHDHGYPVEINVEVQKERLAVDEEKGKWTAPISLIAQSKTYDDNNAEYKLYEIETVCTGEIVNEYPLSEFKNQQERFSHMSSSYMDGEGYELVLARADEFDEDGDPTFDTDERVLCYQGDCGERLHKEAAANVERWKEVLGL